MASDMALNVTKTLRERFQDPRRLHAMRTREIVEDETRRFFFGAGLRHVRTPLLVTSPGMEPHIRPFETTTGAYLPTSPEFAMKQLLAGGLGGIFQICPAFRNEPPSTTHAPEFTMLEWYRAGAKLETIMEDCEHWFLALAAGVKGPDTWALKYQGQTIDLTTPWPRLRIPDLFRDLLGLDLSETSAKLPGPEHESFEDRFFRLWLNEIEPRLPTDRPVFVYDYPPSLAALARVENGWAKRFEIYAGGLELGNAFWELTDPTLQRQRYETFMAERERTYGTAFPRTPLDPEFMRALEEGLPESAGIAVGLDRVVMLFADEPDVRYTFWIEPKSPSV
jgi:lysyl-tRNA synthetase class 2